MSFSIQLRRYAVTFMAIVGLVALALVVGVYIAKHQRLRFPWEQVYTISGEFTSAQAVTPGQGQNVTVAGVTVGEISKVTLRNGRALVQMQLDPKKLDHVYANAHMLLRPKTGLNDMSIELDPGTPAAPRLKDGAVLPAARTTPNVNADEVFAALDSDTRAYLSILLNAGGAGLAHRGVDLRAILRASAPTLRMTRRITAALADRRAKLRRLIGNLRLLSSATATKDAQLGRLVDAGNATFASLASEDRALRSSLARLPGTLGSAQRVLEGVPGFAGRLGGALGALRPGARRLGPALERLRPLLARSEPILRTQLRPLVREARPLAADLPPTLRNLDAVTPDLISSFGVLVRVVNELAYNPPGSEEGYLFWAAWFFHNANSILSIEDAHGVVWRGQLLASCSTYGALPQLAPLLALVVATPACPADASGG